MNNDIKLIVSDLDDTLLNINHKLEDKNKLAIIKAQEKGIKFVLASGRPLYEMIHFVKDLCLDKYNGYIISSNGASIYKANNLENIYIKKINEKDIIDLFNYAKILNTSFIVYINENRYVYNLTKYSEPISIVKGINYITINNISEIELHNIDKVMFVDSKLNTDINLIKLKEKYKNKFNIVKSYYSIIEITMKNINKGNALKYLLSNINIDKKNCIAVGDNYNDVEMLKSVGYPIAVENAVDILKKIAVYISISHNENALYDIIKKYNILN